LKHLPLLMLAERFNIWEKLCHRLMALMNYVACLQVKNRV
jgi:hypothetical protein